ncbi:MAG TPA: glycosyltransferase family 4 protein [Patescibacteria group bacterium]|nr:glycosyltransferase family 4 protein [Patescibacteria group bacterium]
MARFLMIAYTTYMHDGRVKRHAEALAERGDHVDVICLATDERPITNGVNVIGLPMPRYRGASKSAYLRSYTRFFSMATQRALRMSLKQRYDIVIVCTMPDAVIVCAILPKLLGSKVVLDVHDTMPELYRDKFGGARGAAGAKLLMLEERLSSWWADRVLAVHDLHRDRLEHAGVAADKIHVVMNSPDTRIFDLHKNGDSPPNEFTLICHGTVTQRLGLDLAISAVASLRAEIPELRLKVIGEGDRLAEARALVDRLGMQNRVSFMDLVPVEKLPALLVKADVGLVPYRPSSATHLMLPVKLLDYATLGIPVIAARLRTVEHYFGDGAVELFEPANVADLARAIRLLYDDPDLRARLVDRARCALDVLNWRNQRAEYYRAIDSLLAA